MLKKWIKKYKLRYEGVLTTREYVKVISNGLERVDVNMAKDRELWWSNKLKCHMFSAERYSYIELHRQNRLTGCYAPCGIKWRVGKY